MRVQQDALLNEEGTVGRSSDHLGWSAAAVAASITSGTPDRCRHRQPLTPSSGPKFGKPIFDFQVLKHARRRCRNAVDAAACSAIGRPRSGNQPTGRPRERSMAKLYGSRHSSATRWRACRSWAATREPARSGHGALPAGRARPVHVGSGTSQIQRTIVARSMRLPA
ncbi:acyl-CoA dehydrogenase family protein [Pseudonocardia sp. MCCB 268]|nr:acyl-CoA dehydrogenase family protein [Pseudonocardia cytotoxica]